METSILIIAAITAIIAIYCGELHLDFRAKKELFKSNVAFKISCITGIIAVLSILCLMILF